MPVDLLATAPIVVLSGTVVALMGLAAIHRGRTSSLLVTLSGLLLAVLAIVPASGRPPESAGPLLTNDAFGLQFQGVLIVSSAACVGLASLYLDQKPNPRREEMYLLLVLATLGSCVLVSASHFATLFVGIETMSVSIYGLAGYLDDRKKALEAAAKYLVLGSVASAFLFFGMALAYAETSSLSLKAIAEAAASGRTGLLLPGIAFLFVGTAFKVAAFPFHAWIADVYEGAPAPVTTLLATVAKGSVIVLLLRLFPPWTDRGVFFSVLAVAAVASMFVGSLLALRQDNVKRLLAYSSIAHVGYMLTALAAGGADGARAAMTYVITYMAASLAAFGTISLLSSTERDAEELGDFRALYRRNPGLAAIFTISLLSLGGIPLTGGFLGKFTVAAVGVDRSLWVLVLSLVATTLIGFAYYLRLLYAVFEDDEAPREPARVSVWGSAILGVLVLFLLAWGVVPTPFLDAVVASAQTR